MTVGNDEVQRLFSDKGSTHATPDDIAKIKQLLSEKYATKDDISAIESSVRESLIRLNTTLVKHSQLSTGVIRHSSEHRGTALDLKRLIDEIIELNQALRANQSGKKILTTLVSLITCRSGLTKLQLLY
jgi:hypothetical protein